jgi:hypothetical protein
LTVGGNRVSSGGSFSAHGNEVSCALDVDSVKPVPTSAADSSAAVACAWVSPPAAADEAELEGAELDVTGAELEDELEDCVLGAFVGEPLLELEHAATRAAASSAAVTGTAERMNSPLPRRSEEQLREKR